MLLLVPPAIARTPEDRTFRAPSELRAASLRFGLWLAGIEWRPSRARLLDSLPMSGRLASMTGRSCSSRNGRHRYTLTARDGSVRLATDERDVGGFVSGGSLAELAASRAYQQAGMPGLTTAR